MTENREFLLNKHPGKGELATFNTKIIFNKKYEQKLFLSPETCFKLFITTSYSFNLFNLENYKTKKKKH